MNYIEKSLPGMTIVGISIRTSNSRPEEIGTLWGRFRSENPIAAISGRLSDEIYSLYLDYEGDHTQPYTLLLGYAVRPEAGVPKGLMLRHVPASKYAVFDASGPQPATLIATWAAIWQMPLDRAYKADFDLYRADGTVSVHVGIR